MKRLAFILMLFILSCSNPVENNRVEVFTTTYELPYDRHYDHDAMFVSDNLIDTTAILYTMEFTAFNFDDSIKQYPNADPVIYFNYVVTIDYYDTLYYSEKFTTEKDTLIIKSFYSKFHGDLNVSINRYETYKPIDFKCVIKFSYL